MPPRSPGSLRPSVGGSGFKASGLGFKVEVLGLGFIEFIGFRVYRVQGLGF